MIRKFFDTGVETAGGVETATESVDFSKFVYVDRDADQPEAEAVETAAEVEKEVVVEKPLVEKEEPITKEVEKEVTKENEVAKTVQPTSDWSEAIKGIDKKDVLAKLGDKSEILKALGVSEFVINLNEHYDRTGTAADYLKVVGVDYAKVSDDDIILQGIRKEKPNAPEAVIQKFYKKELEKYETDPDTFDSETVEVGNYLKKEKADEYRAKLIEEQKKFTIPQKEVATVDTAKEKADADAAIAQIADNGVSKKIVAEKLLRIGGKDGYNFEVTNPQELVDMATGKTNFFSMFAGANGEIDLDLFYAASAFAKNRAAYEKSLIDHGKTLANKEHLEGDEPDDKVIVTGAKREDSDWAGIEKANKKF